MQALVGQPEWLEVVTAAERPELWERARSEVFFDQVWPEYNRHGNNTGRYFGELFPRYANIQILFADRRSEGLVARGRTIPFRWDGTLEDLPNGIDAVGLRAVDERQGPTALSALAAEVDAAYQGFGISSLVIRAMGVVARLAGLAPLVAPVRPSWKSRYPLTSIERYSAWLRDDGLPFDPWMRVHVRAGAKILRPEPRSLQISAPVLDWETWTQMQFPEEGRYIFPDGLAPLTVSAGLGHYWEPNVWLRHDV